MGNEANTDRGTVLALRAHSPDLFELTLARGDLLFTPGDCVSLAVGEAGTSRPYSIASGLDEPVLRFLLRRLDGGVVSSALAACRPGERVRVSEPFGWFRPGRTDGPFVFIATGTGIAPFLSFVRSVPDRAPQRCLYGVRYAAEAVGLDELRAVAPVDLAVSRQTVGGMAPRRVTDCLHSLDVGGAGHVYLCGLDAMVASVAERLESRGVDPLHIHREVFFHASPATTRLAVHTGG